MAKLIPTNKKNTCPVCGDTGGKCRTTETNLVLCMNTTDNYSTPGGWAFIGMTANDQWGQIVPDNDRVADPEWEKKKMAREAEAQAAEMHRLGQLKTAEQRDSDYKYLIANCPPLEADLSDLTRRGLTAADIKALAVINDGRGGYIIPIKDKDRLIVGGQRRLNDPGNGGRYRWATEGANDLPETGELPLAHWFGAKQSNAIYLCEGTGVKPYLAAKRLKALVIGASGGNFAASRKTLGLALSQYTEAPVILIPDGGATANPQVMVQYATTKAIVSECGREMKVLWWGQITKADGDIDEIDRSVNLKVISWDDFKASGKLQLAEDIKSVKTFSTSDDAVIEQWMIDEQRAAHALDVDADFNPHICFPSPLADLMVEEAGIKSIGYLAYLLPVVSSLLGTTEVTVGRHSAPNVIWSLLVAKTGAGKTPIYAGVTKKLNDWENEEQSDYAKRKAVYEANMATNKKGGGFMGGEDPFLRPMPVHLMFQDASFESVTESLIASNTSSLLWCSDEALTVLGSFNNYSNNLTGKTKFGNTWDAGPLLRNRASTEAISGMVTTTRISFTGGIQPSVAKEMFGSEDPTGFFARFLLFHLSEEQIPFAESVGHGVSKLHPEIARMLKKVRCRVGYPHPMMTLEPEAKQIYIDQGQYYLDAKTDNLLIRGWLNKASKHLLRVGIALHAIECCYDDTKAHGVITGDTLARATYVMGIAQNGSAKMANHSSLDGTSKVLDSVLARLSKEPDGATVKKLKQYCRLLTQAAKEEGTKTFVYIRRLLTSMADLGLIEFDGKIAKQKKGNN